ncbi:lytic transglycosylase domain-containing protein [Gymnodinialimonas sp. 2305UL16-5]|uniref:lytic transglycosylase domain-containing protein n=1 Tax=Gymnodinialimonas mytili TaxID=3126503 RepID=UPI0030AFA6E8
MYRRATLTSALVLCLACASPLAGQGVPVTDPTSFAQRLQVFLNMEEDGMTQVEIANSRANLRDFGNQQVEALDAMIDAFSGVSTFQATFASGTGGDFPALGAVYGPTANAAAGQVFGDARKEIEQLIIRGSQDTYSLPGVAAAGLSPVQWRCLLQALIWQESRFQVGARSPADAFGLTQIIPGTAQDLGIYPEYYTDPYLQVVGGARYLAQQLQAFDGNIIFALGAYNAGPGRIQQYGGVPPFEETQHYVRVIPERYNLYLAAIGGVEATGTIDPTLFAVSSASLVSSGSIGFSENALVNARQALLRVRALVVQIGESTDLVDAMNLNTMMKAEIALIASMRVQGEAARTQALMAQLAGRLARQREAMLFANMEFPEL